MFSVSSKGWIVSLALLCVLPALGADTGTTTAEDADKIETEKKVSPKARLTNRAKIVAAGVVVSAATLALLHAVWPDMVKLLEKWDPNLASLNLAKNGPIVLLIFGGGVFGKKYLEKFAEWAWGETQTTVDDVRTVVDECFDQNTCK